MGKRTKGIPEAWEPTQDARACRELSIPADRTDSSPFPRPQRRGNSAKDRQQPTPTDTPLPQLSRISHQRLVALLYAWKEKAEGAGRPAGCFRRRLSGCGVVWTSRCLPVRPLGGALPGFRLCGAGLQGDSRGTARRSTMVHLSECAGLPGGCGLRRTGLGAATLPCSGAAAQSVLLLITMVSQCRSGWPGTRSVKKDRLPSNSFLDSGLPLPPRCSVI